MFFEITKGERPAPGNWLTYVNESKAAPAENNGFTATPVTKDDSDTAPNPVVSNCRSGLSVSNGLHGFCGNKSVFIRVICGKNRNY